MRAKIILAMAVILLCAGCGAQPQAPPPLASPTQAPTLTATAEPSPTRTPQPPTSTPTLVPPTPTLAPLSMASGIDAIRQRMLHSRETWQSLWIQFSAVQFPPAGSDQFIRLARLQIWIRQPAEVLLLCVSTWGDADPDYIFVSDGTGFLEAELRTGYRQEGEIKLSNLGLFLPVVPLTEMIFECPPAGVVGSLVHALIYPAGLARQEGIYTLVGEETVARRAAVVVEFTTGPDDLIVDRYSLDALTGLVLQHQVLDRTGPTEWVVSEISVFPIVYDPEYPAGLFKLEIPQEVRFQEAPGAGNP